MWQIIHFCPDLVYSVEVLSCFCSNSGLAHVKFMKHILQYVSETLKQSLKFDKKAKTPNVLWAIRTPTLQASN